jgi:hypothetical protein
MHTVHLRHVLFINKEVKLSRGHYSRCRLGMARHTCSENLHTQIKVQVKLPHKMFYIIYGNTSSHALPLRQVLLLT